MPVSVTPFTVAVPFATRNTLPDRKTRFENEATLLLSTSRLLAPNVADPLTVMLVKPDTDTVTPAPRDNEEPDNPALVPAKVTDFVIASDSAVELAT